MAKEGQGDFITGSGTHQLESLGRELKCPICLSLYKTASTLSCNHSFCISCITQSMKWSPMCPICKVPITRREVRPAPQLDSLVNIYKSMESIAGVHFVATQVAENPSEETNNGGRPGKRKDKTSTIKSDCCIKETGVGHLEQFNNGGNLGKRKDKATAIESDCRIRETGLEHSEDTYNGETPGKRKDKSSTTKSDCCIEETGVGHSGKRRKALSTITNQARQKAQDTPPLKEHVRAPRFSSESAGMVAKNRKNQGLKRIYGNRKESNQEVSSNTLKAGSLDQIGRPKLSPFFWLREEENASQEGGTLNQVESTLNMTQTQPDIPPNFSDLKDLDDDDDLSQDQEVTNFNLDSEVFEWTQRPCSPELTCSPFRENISGKSLESSLNQSSKTLTIMQPSATKEDIEERHSDGKSSRKASSKSNRKDHKIEIKKSSESELQSTTCKTLTCCAFCHKIGDSEMSGPIMVYKDDGNLFEKKEETPTKLIYVHKHCAEWAPDIYFIGDTAKNLEAEVVRGRKIKCSGCGMKGAALGCCLKRCRKSYHYPCARMIACKWNENGFIILCPEHASLSFPKRSRATMRPTLRGGSKKVIESSVKPRALPSKSDNVTDKWLSCPWTKVVLCGSALSSTEKEQLSSFVSSTRAAFSKAWNSHVTHIIAGTDENGAARRTFKYLMATIEGKWILKADWMAACIAAGTHVDEQPYEISLDTRGVVDGPKRGRSLAASKALRIFDAQEFYLMGVFTPRYKSDLQALILASGGVVLHRKPLLDFIGCKETFVVYKGECDIEGNADGIKNRRLEAESVASLARAKAIPHTWILDSIAACRLLPLN